MALCALFNPGVGKLPSERKTDGFHRPAAGVFRIVHFAESRDFQPREGGSIVKQEKARGRCPLRGPHRPAEPTGKARKIGAFPPCLLGLHRQKLRGRKL